MIDIHIKRINNKEIETKMNLDSNEISDTIFVLNELIVNLKNKLIEKFINDKKKEESNND